MKQRIIVDGIKVEGDEAQRILDEVLRGGADGTPRRRLPMRLLVWTAIFSGIAAGLTSGILARQIKGISSLWLILISMAVAITVTVIWTHVYYRLHRRQLREAMRRHGFDLCTECGYWLKGLSDESIVCPECGTERAPIGGDEPASQSPAPS